MKEDGGQKTDDRSQMTEGGGRNSEVRKYGSRKLLINSVNLVILIKPESKRSKHS
jgi:hypothetical protein